MARASNLAGTTEASLFVGPVGARYTVTVSAALVHAVGESAAGYDWYAGATQLMALSANGRLTLTSGITCNGLYVNQGIITPTQLTANTNNYAPTGGLGAHKMRISSNAAINITGLTNGADGREIILTNIGTFAITLVHDATSIAANRFYGPNNANYVLRPNASVLLWYDGTSSRWRVISN